MSRQPLPLLFALLALPISAAAIAAEPPAPVAAPPAEAAPNPADAGSGTSGAALQCDLDDEHIVQTLATLQTARLRLLQAVFERTAVREPASREVHELSDVLLARHTGGQARSQRLLQGLRQDYLDSSFCAQVRLETDAVLAELELVAPGPEQDATYVAALLWQARRLQALLGEVLLPCVQGEPLRLELEQAAAELRSDAEALELAQTALNPPPPVTAEQPETP